MYNARVFCPSVDVTKTNFHLNNGKFRIDLTDGEMVYQAALPLEGMPCGDSVRVLASW